MAQFGTAFGWTTGLAALLFMAVAMAAEPGLAIMGKVAHPQSLSLAELRALPQAHVAVTQTSGHGPVVLDCQGPALSALIDRAAPVLEGRKNAALALSVLVTAADGYAVALSFGEFDPNYGGASPLVATDCGGKPLEAPQLVVPGDKHAGRTVHHVVTLEIR